MQIRVGLWRKTKNVCFKQCSSIKIMVSSPSNSSYWPFLLIYSVPSTSPAFITIMKASFPSSSMVWHLFSAPCWQASVCCHFDRSWLNLQSPTNPISVPTHFPLLCEGVVVLHTITSSHPFLPLANSPLVGFGTFCHCNEVLLSGPVLFACVDDGDTIEGKQTTKRLSHWYVCEKLLASCAIIIK